MVHVQLIVRQMFVSLRHEVTLADFGYPVYVLWLTFS